MVSTMVGTSVEIKKVLEMAHKVAKTDASVLIYGESGVGKELVAKEIHNNSSRRNNEMVSINCGALPKDLLESILFGHIKGSFTGAVSDHEGVFSRANKGTLFLDEIGELLPETQVKILRTLQEKEILPVGGTKPIKVDVRLITATNINLMEAIDKGRFRPDLFYRISVFPICVPPLRSRKEDIFPLVKHFLSEKGKSEISSKALMALKQHDWPGNVRELQNVLERMVVLNDSGLLNEQMARESLGEGMLLTSEANYKQIFKTVDQVEKEHILRILKFTGGNRMRACGILGIHPTTLYRKFSRWGILEVLDPILEEQGELDDRQAKTRN